MEDDESSSEDGDRFYVEDILSQEKFWIDDSMKVMKSNIIPTRTPLERLGGEEKEVCKRMKVDI